MGRVFTRRSSFQSPISLRLAARKFGPILLKKVPSDQNWSGNLRQLNRNAMCGNHDKTIPPASFNLRIQTGALLTMPFFSPTITTGNTDTIGNRKRDDDSNYTVGSNNTVDSFVTGVGRNAPDRGDEIYMGLIRSGALASTPLGLAVIPNSIDEIISLGQDARRGEELAKDRYKRVIPFVHSSLTVGRRLDRAVVLVVGSTRQGKSKTINRLVGKALLKVGQTSSGSTTKVSLLNNQCKNISNVVPRSYKEFLFRLLAPKPVSISRCPLTIRQV